MRTEMLGQGKKIAQALANVHNMEEVCTDFYKSTMTEQFFGENGWLNLYMNKVKPSISENFRLNSPEATEILNYCDSILEDPALVKKELTENVLTKEMYDT